MGTFLLLLFVVFVIIPLCKLLWRGWQFHRRWKDATSNLRDAYARAYGQPQGAAGSRQAAQPKRKKKKIDPDVGEYVAFEEIHSTTTTTTSTDSGGKTTFRTESQIEDAVWEDVK